jgi:hypothetical protein
MSLNDFQRTNAIGPDTLFALPQATSQTYAPTDTPPKEVIVEPLALTRLPACPPPCATWAGTRRRR